MVENLPREIFKFSPWTEIFQGGFLNFLPGVKFSINFPREIFKFSPWECNFPRGIFKISPWSEINIFFIIIKILDLMIFFLNFQLGIIIYYCYYKTNLEICLQK